MFKAACGLLTETGVLELGMEYKHLSTATLAVVGGRGLHRVAWA